MTVPARGDGAPEAGRARWLVPGLLALAVAAAGLVGLVGLARGGDDPSAADRTSRSGTLALAPDGEVLWLTSPDDGAVVEVGADDLRERRRVAVADDPGELAWWGDRLVVTRERGTAVAVVDTAAPVAVASEVAVPCGGTHAVAVAPAGGGTPATAFATCPHDDRVAVVDLGAGATVATIDVPGRPTGVVVHDGSVSVSSAVGGQVWTWARADLARAVGAAPDSGATDAPGGVPVLDVEPEGTPAWVDLGRSPSLLGPLDVRAGEVVGAYQLVDNARTPSAEEIAAGADSYGTPLDGRARVEPALAGPCGARFIDVLEPSRTLSEPVAVAVGPDGLVWVVGRSSHTVAVVRCVEGAADERSTMVASFPVGDGARGIALGPDGRTAYVDVGFDHAVARLELPAGAEDTQTVVGPLEPTEPSAVVRRDADVDLSPLAERGRRAFADATDPHLTPQRVVSCSSCHPGGADDGLTWRIETDEIPRKLRRTPPLWQVDPATKPLHWDAGFASTDALVLQTVRELLGGDGLLVDAPAISAYLAELPPPVAPPPTPTERAAARRGEALFRSTEAGCASCHTGPQGTDGRTHDVLGPAADPDAALGAVATPTLLATRSRAPYGHDGRAADLEALFGLPGADHGGAAGLTPDEVADLVAYLGTR